VTKICGVSAQGKGERGHQYWSSLSAASIFNDTDTRTGEAGELEGTGFFVGVAGPAAGGRAAAEGEGACGLAELGQRGAVFVGSAIFCAKAPMDSLQGDAEEIFLAARFGVGVVAVLAKGEGAWRIRGDAEPLFLCKRAAVMRGVLKDAIFVFFAVCLYAGTSP
jgi:hypothetical protein